MLLTDVVVKANRFTRRILLKALRTRYLLQLTAYRDMYPEIKLSDNEDATRYIQSM